MPILIYIRIAFVVGIIGLCLFIRNYYINVGQERCEAEIERVNSEHTQAMSDEKQKLLTDALKKITALKNEQNERLQELQKSEEQNNAETNNSCLSTSRRMRIDAVRNKDN